MRQLRTSMITAVFVALLSFGSSTDLFAAQEKKDTSPAGDARYSSLSAIVAELQMQLSQQQAQIEQLTAALAEQREILKSLKPRAVRVAAITPTLPNALEETDQPQTSSSTDPVTGQELQQYRAKVEEISKKVDNAAANLAGFKFSGDFRFRLDGQLRSGNDVAAPLQNVRSRYRLRLNADKEVDPKFKFHLQLSTGPFNVGTTNDQDMAGTIAKHPFSIAEAYVDFHPTSKLSVRGGRMEEIFADNMRFLWDDDIRFNGFQQIVTVPFAPNSAGFKNIEFRAGEYILSNPNIAVLSSSSPFVAAGYPTGQKVRDSNLFHPGFILKQDLGKVWTHQIGADFQYYRNPNQIQLASTTNGFPVLVSNALGLALSGPMSASGNTTTTPGGAIYAAPNFQIARATYRIQNNGVMIGNREMPLYLDFQAARNTGTHFQRDAVMGSVNFGAIKNRGDVRLLYQFALKQANSLISQFTDDDLGTGTGVNIRVHALRADFGLTRFLQWQNLLFLQNEISPNNAARQFFVPLQAGANRTYRYLGQLAFTF
jgi:hypothetical protein